MSEKINAGKTVKLRVFNPTEFIKQMKIEAGMPDKFPVFLISNKLRIINGK